MDVEAAAVASAVMPYMSAVVGAYGSAVLDRLEDAAADVTVGLGGRLLRRVLHRAESRQAVEGAVVDLAANPNDVDSLAALRLQIRKVLAADQRLVEDMRQMLESSGGQSTGRMGQQVAAFDQAQQAVQGYGIQTVTFGSPVHRSLND